MIYFNRGLWELAITPGLFVICMVCSQIIGAHAGELRLAEGDVIRLTLQNNSKIRLAYLDYEISRAERDASSYDFDYHATLALPYSKDVALSNYTYDVAVRTDRTVGPSLGIKTKTRLGTKLEAVLQSLRVRTDSPLAFYSTRYQFAGSLKATQPLLRGAGRVFNETQEKKAAAASVKYRFKTIETVNQQLREGLNAFWDLYTAKEEREMAQAAVTRAKELLASSSAMYRAGKRSYVDFLMSESNLALSEAKLVLRRTEYINSEETLARAVLPLDRPLVEELALVPVVKEVPIILSSSGPGSDCLVSKTPRLARIGAEINEAEIDFDKSKKNLLPQLDISAEYLSSGLASNLSAATLQAFRQKIPSFELVLSFSMPIGGHYYTGDFKQKQGVSKAKTANLEQERAGFELDCKVRINRIGQLAQSLEVIRKRLRLGEQKLDAKYQMYKNGVLSLQEYLDGVDDYLILRSDKIRKYAALQKERFYLQESLGTIGANEKNEFIKSLEVMN